MCVCVCVCVTMYVRDVALLAAIAEIDRATSSTHACTHAVSPNTIAQTFIELQGERKRKNLFSEAVRFVLLAPLFSDGSKYNIRVY